MTVTSNSLKALELYNEAYDVAFLIVDLDKAIALYKKAISEDPEFFMAYYQLATYYFFHGQEKEFEENALAATKFSVKLNKGEAIQKKVLERWLADKKSSVSDLGLRLVEMFPDDPDAHINLGFYHFIGEEFEEAIVAFEKAESMGSKEGVYCGPKLAIVPICMLGYTYLRTSQLEESKMSFDKYIEKYPDDQNPYDCKADYFMTVEDYSGAYKSYMKAYQIDTTYGAFLERALYARNLGDSLLSIQ